MLTQPPRVRQVKARVRGSLIWPRTAGSRGYSAGGVLLVGAVSDRPLRVDPMAILPAHRVGGDIGLGAVLAALVVVDGIHALQPGEAVAIAEVEPVGA